MSSQVTIGWMHRQVAFIDFPEKSSNLFSPLENITKPVLETEFINVPHHDDAGKRNIVRTIGRHSWKPIVFTFLQSSLPDLAAFIQRQVDRQLDSCFNTLTDTSSYKFEMHVPSWKVRLQGCFITGVDYQQRSVDSDDQRIAVVVHYDYIQPDEMSNKVA